VSRVLCLDIGSTWTKGALVSESGAVLGTAQHPTTLGEVLDGVEHVAKALDATDAEVLTCSSAGGGLRLAVVGHERLISAEAGRLVALSSGAKVVHVSAGELDPAGVRELRAARADVLLLVGGTDGGDAKVLSHNAKRLAAARITAPIVLAGNREARDAVAETLTGRTVVPTENVLPDVGELAPGPARQAIREVFLRHVIGGKGLSRRRRFQGMRFAELVRAVTPDAVLAGVSTVASVHGGDEAGAILVVDVGGATTDVYSAVSTLDEERERVVALPRDRRTVEGDIGMRSNAAGVVTEALAERLLDEAEARELTAIAETRAAATGWVPVSDTDWAHDVRLAGLAAVIALRRHLRLVGGALGPRGAGLLVLSGGVFRNAEGAHLATVDTMLSGDPVLRPILKHARIVVDTDYVLAPAGLLAAAGRKSAADALVRTLSQ
jgi:uncharacterized protein (TIGR01319 family)